jgi:hypothetical protein
MFAVSRTVVVPGRPSDEEEGANEPTGHLRRAFKHKMETVAMRHAKSRQESQSRTFSVFPVSKGVNSRVREMVGGGEWGSVDEPEPLRLSD